MMLAFGVANKLGMTLGFLFETMTFEELVGWHCYFIIVSRERKKAMERASRARGR